MEYCSQEGRISKLEQKIDNVMQLIEDLSERQNTINGVRVEYITELHRVNVQLLERINEVERRVSKQYYLLVVNLIGLIGTIIGLFARG